MPKLFDDQGLTEIDRENRDRLTESMGLTSAEKRSLTNMMAAWRKDASAVVKASQKVFNLMRRLQESDADGYCTCVSTGERHHYTKMDAGHFVSDTCNATRFDPNNVWPQTKKANNHKHGDDGKIRYTLWMVDRFGPEYVGELLTKSEQKKSWLKDEYTLLEMRIGWQRQVNQMESKK